MSTTPDPLTDELVTFVQHMLPGLDDGEYELTVEQKVHTSSDVKISDDLQNIYRFAVFGDRFAFSAPTTALLSVFPPEGATGEFSAVLPHVVLGDVTFPWARHPAPGGSKKRPEAGTDVDDDVPTWLAVLVLDEDDAAANPGLVLAPATATVGDLFPPQAVSGSTLGSNYSYFWQNPTVTELDPNQQVLDQIRVLDVPLALFWQIAPTIDDLKLTAHTRQVALANRPTGQRLLSRALAGKAGRAGAEPAEPPHAGASLGTASIVFGTRLPQGPQPAANGAPANGGRKTFAHLVSLEGLKPFLPTDSAGGPPSGSTFAPGASLRLAVLTSWTFYTTGDTAGFVNGLLALNGRDPDGTADAANTTLRLKYTGPNPTVAAALGMGFVPLNESLRDEGQTVSWYRGPCNPYLNTAPGLPLPIASSDQALLFDPTTGMFDTSYAAAWSLGRQLALQDTAFAAALYRWKAEQVAAIVSAVDAEFLARAFGPLVAAPAPEPAAAGRPMRLSRSLRRQLMLALPRRPGG
jgi:hypothetical protein